MADTGNPNESLFVPSYPDAETWSRMSEDERAAFNKRYNDAIGRTKESTGSEADDPEEPTSHSLA